MNLHKGGSPYEIDVSSFSPVRVAQQQEANPNAWIAPKSTPKQNHPYKPHAPKKLSIINCEFSITPPHHRKQIQHLPTNLRTPFVVPRRFLRSIIRLFRIVIGNRHPQRTPLHDRAIFIRL